MTRFMDGNHFRILRSLAFVMLFFMVYFYHAGPASADDRLSEILKGILKRYADLPGLTVPYKREIITKSMALLGDQAKMDLAKGRIYFKPSNFLKIEQDTPRPETVTTDGERLWWYIPHKRLVYQYPSNKLGKELGLLNDIFRGLREVGDSFDVIQSDLDDTKKHQLKLIPNPPWQDIDHINLSVARDNFDIKIVEIHNFLGSITRFTLGDFSVQGSFGQDFFRFLPPDGVKVIKENPG